MTRRLGVILAAALIGASASAQQMPGNMPRPVPENVHPSVHYSDGIVGDFDQTYESVRGYRPLKLSVFYAPDSAAARPAVIWIHGGAWMGGDPMASSELIPARDQQLARMAARGYVMVGLSYRLSGEAKFPAQINDVKAAVRWLRANAATYHIDPQRIAVWGASAGGYLAVLAGTTCQVAELEGEGAENASQSSCVQAVIDWFGILDFKKALAKNANDGAILSLLGCMPGQCADALLQRSNPFSYIKAGDPPFLIMHGDADTLVPIQESQDLLAALKAKGVSARMETIHGASHEWGGASKTQVDSIFASVQSFLDTTFNVKPPH